MIVLEGNFCTEQFIFWLKLLFVMFLLVHAGAGNLPAAGENPRDIYERISKGRPRLFLNRSQLEDIRGNMTANRSSYLKTLKRRVDAYPDSPDINMQTVTGGTWLRARDNLAPHAANTALVYLMTGEQAYLEKAANILEAAVETFRLRYENDLAVEWSCWSRLLAMAAFDWIASDLPDARREIIGRNLFKHIKQTQTGPIPSPEHRGRPVTAFYGTAMLQWYAGLVFLDAGFDDELARKWLREGYSDHMEMFRHRSGIAGKSGETGSPTYGYTIGFSHVDFNFRYSWQSAVDEAFPEEFSNMGLFPNWLIWNTIPGSEKGLYHEFGTGRAWHLNDNKIDFALHYLAEYGHFFGEAHPELSAVARYLLKNSGGFNVARLYQGHRTHPVFVPLLLDLPPDGVLPVEEGRAEKVFSRLPYAMRFPVTGTFTMASGREPNDTYALFTAGSNRENKHLDENNFIIYRKGFLALDTGTRGAAGAYDEEGKLRAHEVNYWYRTVAHNCILIRMEGETFGGGRWANDGGQNSHTGADILAYETNDHYTYIASDAAKAYHPGKCAKALRQFVFVYPDYFIIFDRVVSREARQEKTWLLHTQNEPVVNGDTFSAVHREGKLFCRTLLPVSRKSEKIGGPGREFLSDGRNWPLPENRRADMKTGLMGNWRIEISPGETAEKTEFLHFIQVGDKNELVEMTPSELISGDNTAGVKFKAGENTVSVSFNLMGPAGGRIKITDKSSEAVLDKPLAESVQEQMGLDLAR